MIQGYLLIVICKTKKKRKIHIFSVQWHKMYITIPKEKNGGIMRKYRTKARSTPKATNSKPCSSMPDDNGLRGSSLPALLTATRFFLELAPHPECISPWQTSQNSSTSTVLESLMPFRLHFHSFLQWPLLAFMKELPCNMPGLSTFA